MLWLLLIVGLVAAGAFLIWWLIFQTEGVYLGRRVVIWLYDVYATRYDSIVQHDDIDEHLYLAQPLMSRLDNNRPLILDVATGTGRLPLALCQHARFEGQIIALDLSTGMLNQAIEKIHANHFSQYVTFLQANGQHLPFAENTFEVVTCLEALEFMPQPEAALSELVRVLQPGGLLLTTQRINERWMPGRLWNRTAMTALLHDAGMHHIEFIPWQHDYTKVLAYKKPR
jgi:ubiquinone/menaquinone biosynthesis C-methylase UbiE